MTQPQTPDAAAARPAGDDPIDQELFARGLLPTGPAGKLAADFIAHAPTPAADAFVGALLGAACGDALGRPVEGRQPAEIKARYGELRDFVADSRWRGGPLGRISDDTQLTSWTARSLLDADRDAHPERFAALLAARLDVIRGIGRATRRAVIRLVEGRRWWRAGTPSAGNGVAMRVAPLGLVFGADLEQLRRQTARNAVVTHADRLAVGSGIVQAYAVARLARTAPGTLDPKQFIGELIAVLRGFDDVGGVERRPAAGPDRVLLTTRLKEVGEMLELSPAEAFERTYNGAYVLESLPAALWAFLSRREAPEEAIVVAVNGGFDADTVAAMAGAMAGAYHGAAALPRRWIDDLEGAEDLEALAKRLHRQATRTSEASAEPAVDQTNADRIHVAVLLDRSGSMGRITDDTIGGFNAFITQQKALTGDCKITLVQFDGPNCQDVVVDAVAVSEVPELTKAAYQPRGDTPLLDALGTLIERLGTRAAADPEEFQLVAVITDGQENASRRFSRDRIADMVADRSEQGWAFVFLGANIDSFAEAGAVGMHRDQAANWDHSPHGVRDGFDVLSVSSRSYRHASGRSAKHALKDRLMQDARERRSRGEF